MILIDGKAVSLKVQANLKEQVAALKAKGKSVGLAVIIVGENPASKVYVKNKIAACENIGIKSFHYELSEKTTEEELNKLIDGLNENKEVSGILVQLPLPKHLSERKILSRIDVKKDVDGFSAYQTGLLCLGEDCLPCCTPSGVMELLHEYKIDIAGRHAVVIGRSNIVGKPMSLMLLKEHATVTICHSKTKNLAEITRQADILVAAIGQARFVKADMVKDGAVVIDVGMNRVDGVLCGDVDFSNVSTKCSYITPVPGGVGPMTVTMLMRNTILAAR